MTKKDFLEIISICSRTNNNMDLLNNVGIDMFESSFSNDINFLLNFIIKNEYGEEGLDWFTWWLFELPIIMKKKETDEPYANDANGNPIIIDTPEQLYDFLEKEYGKN